ncbi:hypothetical protein ACFLR0_01185 [Candidatus Bipolaricaulota bacterium]
MSSRQCVRIAILLSLGSVALLLGCSRSHSSVEAIEYRPVSFATGTSVEVSVLAVNGSVSIHGEGGRTATDVTAILRASGRSRSQAQERVEGLPVRMIQQGERVELAFELAEEAKRWDEPPSVLFEVRLPAQAVISVTSSNGAVRVAGIEGRIVIDMERGTVEVERSEGEIDLTVANGEIRVSDAAGVLRARGERSDILVEASDVSADLETIIGDVGFSGRFVGPDHRIHASNGVITLNIPTDSELQLEATVSTGRIESGLPFVGDTEGMEWSAVLNAASSLLSLRSTNGWIRIDALDNI